MNLEPFARGTSPLHALDPRIKLSIALAFAVVVALGESPRGLFAALAVAIGSVGLARLHLRALTHRLFLVNGFVILLWFVLPFTFPGQEAISLGPLTASREGLQQALVITLRTNAIVLATISLLGTTAVFSLLQALRSFRLPEHLIHTAFFSYRYIDVIHREYLRLRGAMKVRCFRPRTSLHTYRTYAYLLGMLLVRSYERSQRIDEAMRCRAFKGTYPVYHRAHLQRRDLISLVAASVTLVVLSVL